MAGVGIITIYDFKMYFVFSHFLLTFSTTATTTTKHRCQGKACRERTETHTALIQTTESGGVTAGQRRRRAHTDPQTKSFR